MVACKWPAVRLEPATWKLRVRSDSLTTRPLTPTLIYIIKGIMFVCLFCMAGQTAGPIETKLDTRTHVHPGSVSGKVNVKIIHVCVRDWQNYETPGKRHLANAAQTTSRGRGRRHLANAYETPSGRCVIFTARVTRPQARVELRPEDGYLQLVYYIDVAVFERTC